jgi:hypothetical protein
VGLPLINNTLGSVLRESTLFDGLGRRKREGDLPGSAENLNVELMSKIQGRGQRPSVESELKEIGMSRRVEHITEA